MTLDDVVPFLGLTKHNGVGAAIPHQRQFIQLAFPHHAVRNLHYEFVYIATFDIDFPPFQTSGQFQSVTCARFESFAQYRVASCVTSGRASVMSVIPVWESKCINAGMRSSSPFLGLKVHHFGKSVPS
jgi:hypothetical protein